MKQEVNSLKPKREEVGGSRRTNYLRSDQRILELIIANVIVWQCRHETRLQKEGGELVGEQVKSRFAACALSLCADREPGAVLSVCCCRIHGRNSVAIGGGTRETTHNREMHPCACGGGTSTQHWLLGPVYTTVEKASGLSRMLGQDMVI